MKGIKVKLSRRQLIRNVKVTTLLMLFATAVAGAFFVASRNSSNVAIVYELTVMVIARSTDGYVPGIVASVIGVICVNYAFTYPYMMLNFNIDGYSVTFLGMMAISVITSALTTKAKKQNQLLIEQEKFLMEAEKERMRANLLRAVSHDLRTPLTGIIGMAGAFLENQQNLSEDEKARMVRGISEDAGWLLNMVENLLSVTRIHVEDAHVNTNKESIEEVVSEAVQRVRKRLPQIKVRVRVPEEFLMVSMDATLIEQVIINLLENAWYHSGVEDTIDFCVECEDGEVVFHIRDYGQGIDPKRIGTIFEGCGTDQNQSGDSHKGMGIGLIICKTIIAAHHGKIYARNREKGVEFIFTLPIEEEKEDGE